MCRKSFLKAHKGLKTPYAIYRTGGFSGRIPLKMGAAQKMRVIRNPERATIPNHFSELNYLDSLSIYSPVKG